MTGHFSAAARSATGRDGRDRPLPPRLRYHGLHMIDGSAISANLGSTRADHHRAGRAALSIWPNKGEADPRPAICKPYRGPAAGRPRKAPVVPADAPGALRLPIVQNHDKKEPVTNP